MMAAPPPILPGASNDQSFLPVRVSSAAIVFASVPTNTRPLTALTGPKIFPANASEVQRIFPVAGSSEKTFETFVGALVLGSPTFDDITKRPSTNAAEPITPPKLLPGVRLVSQTT